MSKRNKSNESPQGLCAYPGCRESATYPAPRSKENPRDFLWFCLEHIRLYNAKWDYLGGLSEQEIEKVIREGTVWERPTWPFGKGPTATTKRPKAPRKSPKEETLSPAALHALGVLDLAPPVSFATVKARYRELVKRTHPDSNAGSRAKVEKFHAVQEAFATLKRVYAKETKRKSS